MRRRFEGDIAGLGSASGLRIVVGRWQVSDFGPFADVMLEQADGCRVLLAPSAPVAEFVSATYAFDEVVLTPVLVETSRTGWHVETDQLVLDVDLGHRTALGWVLRAVPGRVAIAPWFAVAVDPLARVALRGVRTTGRTSDGRRQWYGARDLHRITASRGSWHGADIGELVPVRPPVRFGFGSTPARPSVTRVVSTVEVSSAG